MGFDFGSEFQAQPETAEKMELNVPATESAEAAEKQTYPLKDGTMGSRAAYIRELFLVDNLSRKEIAEKTGFPYRVVYGATVNMANESEPTGRGRTVANPFIFVYGDEKALVKKHENGEYYDAATGEIVPPEQVMQISRNEWIIFRAGLGVSRGEIAKQLELSYGVVYGLTKEQEGTRMKYDITLEDGTVVSRSEYIRMQFHAGKSRSEIAKELDVPYAVVWQATKTEKSDGDKFADLVEQIKTFGDRVVDEGIFTAALAALELVEIKISAEDQDAAAQAQAVNE